MACGQGLDAGYSAAVRELWDQARLAGSLGTFGLRDATAHAAALEAAFSRDVALADVPGLARHALELRQLVEAGEAGGAPPAAGRAPDVFAVGSSIGAR